MRREQFLEAIVALRRVGGLPARTVHDLSRLPAAPEFRGIFERAEHALLEQRRALAEQLVDGRARAAQIAAREGKKLEQARKAREAAQRQLEQARDAEQAAYSASMAASGAVDKLVGETEKALRSTADARLHKAIGILPALRQAVCLRFAMLPVFQPDAVTGKVQWNSNVDVLNRLIERIDEARSECEAALLAVETHDETTARLARIFDALGPQLRMLGVHDTPVVRADGTLGAQAEEF